MSNTALLKDYVGGGLDAGLPNASVLGPTIPTGMSAYYYATDTNKLYGLKGGDTAWTHINGGTPVEIQDEGSTLTSNVASINFTGSGVTATTVGDNVEVNIPGGGGGGDLTKIAEIVATGTETAIDFTSIPGSYVHLLILGQARLTSATSDVLHMRMNNDSSNVYYSAIDYSRGGGSTNVTQGPTTDGCYTGNVTGGDAGAGEATSVRIDVPNYLSGFYKQTVSEQSYTDSANNQARLSCASTWRDTSAITRLTLRTPGDAAFESGTTFSLYGLS